MANDLLSDLEGIYGTDLTEQELASGIKPTAEAAGTPLHRIPGFEYSAAARDFGYLPSAYKLYLSGGFPEETTDPVQEFIGGETIDTGIVGEGEGETNIAAQLGTVDTSPEQINVDTPLTQMVTDPVTGQTQTVKGAFTTDDAYRSVDTGIDTSIDTTPDYSGAGTASPIVQARGTPISEMGTRPPDFVAGAKTFTDPDPGARIDARGTTLTGTRPPDFVAGIPTLTDPVPGSITHPKASPVVQDRIAGPDYSDVTTAVAPPSILARDEEALSELEAARTGQTPEDMADAQKPEVQSLFERTKNNVQEFLDNPIAKALSNPLTTYNILKGNLLKATASYLNPVGLGVGLLAGELPKSKSQIEYEGYTSGQQGSIDQAYGPGGIMEGYNAVSAFGKGPVATMKDRYNERTSNGIFDETTKKLEKHIKDLDPGFKGKTEGDVDDDPTGDAQVAEDTYAEETGIDLTDFGFEDLKGGGADMGATGPTGPSDGGFGDESGRRGGGADMGGTGGAPTGTGGPPSQGGRSGGSPGQGGGSPKIVCTMMNESYGFGSFRNKIWLRQSKNLAPEYQKGYHKIFLPLVKLSKKNIVLKKILEHIAIHRTIDIRQEARGKRHLLGRIYRRILEPICYWVGKNA